MEPFQTQAQLRALRLHAALSKAWHFVVDPVVNFFDYKTDIFRDKKPALKVVK